MDNKVVAFCNNNLSGLIHFREGVIKDFASKGWRIIIILPQSTIKESLLDQLDPNWVLYQVKVNPNDINPIGDIKYFFQLITIFRKEKPKIVFQYTIKPNIYGSLACKILGLKCISMVAGLGYVFEGNSIKKKVGRMLYKIGLRASDKVFVLNRSNRHRLLEGGFVKPENIILLEGGEGVNLKKYPYKPMEFKDLRFLMIARVLYDKGYTEYVEAAKIVKSKYPDIEFELLGPLAPNSPMGVPAEQVYRDHKDNTIRYLGVTNDVPSFVLRDGVIIVLGSKYLEGLNRSLMEACAMGRPIITTDNPGCRETVEAGKNGLIVPSADSKALAQAMIKIIELSKEEKIKMSIASRERAIDLFNEENVIKQYWTAFYNVEKM